MSALARRYARAAVDAAEESGGSSDVDALATSLRGFRDSYRASDELQELILNPALKGSRDNTLRAIFPKLGVGDLARALLLMLADRDRIDILDALVTEVEGIADERAGRMRAYVSSPKKLTAAQLERIGKALEKRFGLPMVVTADLEPEMLGGLLCHVGDVTLDFSVRRQLEILREQLEGNTH